MNHDIVSSLRWVTTTFVESMDAAQAMYLCLRELDPVQAMATLSTIEHDDFSILNQMLRTNTFSVLIGEGKPMLDDQISSLMLEYIVRENGQFEIPFLNHRVELYTRSKTESMRLLCAGLPDMKCPDLSHYGHLLPDGMTCCTICMLIADDQFLKTSKSNTCSTLKVSSLTNHQVRPILVLSHAMSMLAGILSPQSSARTHYRTNSTRRCCKQSVPSSRHTRSGSPLVI